MERSFDLGPDAEAFIDETLEGGRYETADDVVRRSLQLLRAHEAAIRRRDEAIQGGIDAADRGEVRNAEQVFDDLDRYIKEIAAERASRRSRSHSRRRPT